MCGICGVIQLGGEPRSVVAPAVLDWMTDAMTHRGPNDRGTYQAPGVALGARRLSIVDLAGGHQPLASEDGRVWAIQNGELYNHGELRRELGAAGHRFQSRCDTEVLPHLYERDGPAFPERLRGKFGLAVWDERRRRAVLARDRLGVKPLYYAQSGDLLVFASELKSVLASGLVGIELDYEAIEAYLSFGFFPGPHTPLAGVAKLLPGHRLVVEAGAVRCERYWAYPQPVRESPRRSAQEYAEGLLAELEESVRLRLMSDVPLGAMLSGGLDSSLIVALMARNMSEPVKTFSVGFAEDGEFNELADARYVASVFGTDHHELELSFAAQQVDLAELVWHLDEPLADLSALGFLALSELAAGHVTVALCGQGADELLGGYERHRAVSVAAAWSALPRTIRTTVEKSAPRVFSGSKRRVRILSASDPASQWLAVHGKLDEDLRSRLLRGPLAALDGEAPRRVVSAHAAGLQAGPLPAFLYLDAQLALVDDMLHYFDRASMAHSLEVRVPFLDHHVVEYCARIPGDLKVRRLRTKHLLKEGARGLLPDRVIDKRKIGFFSRAVDGWFRAQSQRAIADYLLAPSPRFADFLDRSEVSRLIAAHADGRDASHGPLLLSILMLEIWLSSYLPRVAGPPVASQQPVRLSA